jgi:transcriptional regulator with XRE-family HTH domain
MTTKTPAQLKAIRHSHGWSSNQMAKALGLASGSRVREFESPVGSKSHKTPAGPTALIYRLIAGDLTLDQHMTAIDAMKSRKKVADKA